MSTSNKKNLLESGRTPKTGKSPREKPSFAEKFGFFGFCPSSHQGGNLIIVYYTACIRQNMSGI